MALGPAVGSAPFPTSETQSTSEYTGVFGGVLQDPAAPLNRYMLVDCQEALVIGEIVCISAAGLASQITDSSVGIVGVIVAAVSGSDTAAWAQIGGSSAVAIFDSDVTTACFLFAPATTEGGFLDIMTSTEANMVHGARCTVAPSTATTPFTSASDASAITGVGTLTFALGGAFVYGLANNVGATT